MSVWHCAFICLREEKDSKKYIMCYGYSELFYAFLWIKNQMTELTVTFITQLTDRGWLWWWNRSPPQDTFQPSHPKSYMKAIIRFNGLCRAAGLENYYSSYFGNTMARRYTNIFFFTFKMISSVCVCMCIIKTEWEFYLSQVLTLNFSSRK